MRYLGIIIDNNLSWKHHIDHVAMKMSRTVGLICKVRHFLPRLVKLFVASYVTYGLMAWGQACKPSQASKAELFALSIFLREISTQFLYLLTPLFYR